jgi:hypothetical protein
MNIIPYDLILSIITNPLIIIGGSCSNLARNWVLGT